MGTLQQQYYKVYVQENNTWKYIYSNNEWINPSNFYGQDIIQLDDPETHYISKISIQAPPGMKVKIDGKEIVIGRSGLYDLDNEDLRISTVVFEQPTVVTRQSIDPTEETAYESFFANVQSNIESYDTMAALSTYLAKSDFIVTVNQQTLATGNIQQIAATYNEARAGKVILTPSGDAENIIINYVVE